MYYKNYWSFIDALESVGELIRLKEFVDPVLEISEITDRYSKQKDGGKAILFTNTGTDFPVVTNAMGSYKRICLALGTNNLDQFGAEINGILKQFSSEKNSLIDKIKLIPLFSKIASWMPKTVSGKGKCQEVIHLDADLSILPILKCWPADGGRFITLPLVHTIDPVTGVRNVGMYRMQVFDKNLTGMHWHRHKTGARHYEQYKKLGRLMPVAVALGGDPAYTYTATAPLPDQVDEYLLAGFIRKKRVELVKCITQDIDVPKDADIVIEGYIDPAEELIWEGPFGDHTGFYSLEDWYPKFHVTCITHRHDAVYPATIVGVPPQEDAWIAKATERIFLMPMKYSYAPEIADIDLPPAGVAHNLAILSIEKRYPGQGLKVINSLWGAGQMMFNKVMVVTDKDIDIHDYQTLFRYLLEIVRIPDDLMFSKGPLDILDHASDSLSYGSKLGIDATRKSVEEQRKNDQYRLKPSGLDVAEFLNQYQSICSVSTDLLEESIPVLLFSVQEEYLKDIASVFTKLGQDSSLAGIKLFVCFDSKVDLNNHYLCCWLAFSNIDPHRDCRIIDRNKFEASLFVDATTKTSITHGINRPWPNVVCSSEQTIKTIDAKWDLYFKEKFMSSPSFNYQQLSSNSGAVAAKNNM